MKGREYPKLGSDRDQASVKLLLNTGLRVSDNYARKRNASTLIRGLRAVSDFEKELQMAHTNKSLWSELETVFLATSNEYSFLSSSIAKEVARYGGRVSHLVPPCVEVALREKFREYS
jgi:pantetheine-phosphate adenylyltransferase